MGGVPGGGRDQPRIQIVPAGLRLGLGLGLGLALGLGLGLGLGFRAQLAREVKRDARGVRRVLVQPGGHADVDADGAAARVLRLAQVHAARLGAGGGGTAGRRAARLVRVRDRVRLRVRLRLRFRCLGLGLGLGLPEP